MEQVASRALPPISPSWRRDPQEFAELLNTVLINVTSFFRDPDAWDVLRQEVCRSCWRSGGREASCAIWSAGCATGEEPYSLAMLLAEALGAEEFAAA